MEIKNLKVSLLPHTPFLKENGKFDLKKALIYSGQIGGICYNEDGLRASFEEDVEKSLKRVDRTTYGEHQSIYEHINIGLYLENSPKFLNMLLNNEHQYSTSERSLRYTKIDYGQGLPDGIVDIYNKWNNIFFTKIKEQYGNVKSDAQIMKLAQENSRYLMPVTIPVEMVHTIPLAQLHRVLTYLMDYAENGINGKKDDLHEQMLEPINSLYSQLKYNLDVIDERLMSNRKHRTISLIGENLDLAKDEFGEVYSTTYKTSFASLAQAHRHRTIYYQMERNEYYKDYYIPPIIEGNYLLINEWLNDMNRVAEQYGLIPQGELVRVHEKGTFDNFVLKMKERLCSAAQVEVADRTRMTRDQYYRALQEYDINHTNYDDNDVIRNNMLLDTMGQYMNGARCTFPDYDCPKGCGFEEGIKLKRKI